MADAKVTGRSTRQDIQPPVTRKATTVESYNQNATNVSDNPKNSLVFKFVYSEAVKKALDKEYSYALETEDSTGGKPPEAPTTKAPEVHVRGLRQIYSRILGVDSRDSLRSPLSPDQSASGSSGRGKRKQSHVSSGSNKDGDVKKDQTTSKSTKQQSVTGEEATGLS